MHSPRRTYLSASWDGLVSTASGTNYSSGTSWSVPPAPAACFCPSVTTFFLPPEEDLVYRTAIEPHTTHTTDTNSSQVFKTLGRISLSVITIPREVGPLHCFQASQQGRYVAAVEVWFCSDWCPSAAAPTATTVWNQHTRAGSELGSDNAAGSER